MRREGKDEGAVLFLLKPGTHFVEHGVTMKVAAVKVFLVVMVVLAASFAQGEIYTWTDHRGIAHYTNRMDDVPVRFRNKVKVLVYESEHKPGTPPAGQQNNPDTPIPGIKPAESVPAPVNATPVSPPTVRRGKSWRQGGVER